VKKSGNDREYLGISIVGRRCTFLHSRVCAAPRNTPVIPRRSEREKTAGTAVAPLSASWSPRPRPCRRRHRRHSAGKRKRGRVCVVQAKEKQVVKYECARAERERVYSVRNSAARENPYPGFTYVCVYTRDACFQSGGSIV
jgi:hypothetical protein